MTLSAEQRAEINRLNSLKSTGPKTPEGKARSRLNALKHGMRAAAEPLPGEDPQAAADWVDFWIDFYDPASPAAVHDAVECARNSMRCQRIGRAINAAAATRMHEAVLNYEDEASKRLQEHIDELRRQPAVARAALARTAVGCCWLHERWLRLLHKLDDRARLAPGDAAEAVRLLGSKTGKALRSNPNAWIVRLLTMLLGGTARSVAIARMFDPEVQPKSLRAEFRIDALPNFDETLTRLWTIFTDEIEHWRAEEARLRAEEHRPEVARARSRALIPEDDRRARLELRYESEARGAYRRSWAALQQSLADDAARAAPDEPDPGPIPSAVPDPTASTSPNEANQVPVPSAVTPCPATPRVPRSPLTNLQDERRRLAEEAAWKTRAVAPEEVPTPPRVE